MSAAGDSAVEWPGKFTRSKSVTVAVVDGTVAGALRRIVCRDRGKLDVEVGRPLGLSIAAYLCNPPIVAPRTR